MKYVLLPLLLVVLISKENTKYSFNTKGKNSDSSKSKG